MLNLGALLLFDWPTATSGTTLTKSQRYYGIMMFTIKKYLTVSPENLKMDFHLERKPTCTVKVFFASFPLILTCHKIPKLVMQSEI